MDRPTALDLAFKDLSTPEAPLVVGWTLRFDGPAPGVAALRRWIGARLGGVPRFRRRLTAGAWVDDVRFDVGRHVFGVSAAPGTSLRELAGTLLSAPLPEDRPLWRLYVVDGLDEGGRGGFALVGQAHHALVDGIAAIEVAMLLFGPEGASADAWTPAAGPSAAEAFRTTAGARVRAAAGAMRSGDALLGTAARAVETVVAARGVAPSALERSSTARRGVAYASVPLEAVRAAGARRDATINDVLLAATSVALRAALRRRDDPRDTLRVLVPVNTRGADGAEALGNRISFLPVELPVGEPDPDRALAVIRARTAAAKAGGDAAALDALGRAADALPGMGRRVVARAALRAVPFTLVVSNVPGPPVRLELLGRPLRAIHPMVPLLHGHALTVGAVSYEGALHVGLAADAEVVPDVVDIARDVEAAFDALRVATPPPQPGTTPWRTRARERRAAAQRAANR